MADNFPLPIPNGWFAVGYSDELAAGEVVPMRYFGKDLVAFRDEQGVAHVLDAHCPHLGAHLGHGGTVVGETVRCPFHAWRWDGATGQCVEIPYAEKIPPKMRIRSWPTRECNRMILVWHDLAGGEPTWQVRDIPEATSADWSDPERFEWTIATQVQELAENGVDTAHFKYVHGTKNIPDSELEIEGPFRHTNRSVKLETPRGEVQGGIESHAFGMGLSVTRFTGICETLELLATTPIDENHVIHRKYFSQQRVDGENPRGGVAAAIIRNVVKQLEQDIPIWEHKVYRERPRLCDGDGPIGQFRRWCRQFYTLADDTES